MRLPNLEQLPHKPYPVPIKYINCWVEAKRISGYYAVCGKYCGAYCDGIYYLFTLESWHFIDVEISIELRDTSRRVRCVRKFKYFVTLLERNHTIQMGHPDQHVCLSQGFP
ncbi:hypothetical protein FGO68_gene10153 [Halteria grandinella]|uniref:Uncharacterized protein n=1 Tax=Halteria grandinella TaxID=5974 RepID=A0A8J8P583_HALGN|nr:hypothetical protein FGO68_gene10153 [Halteria grandinella]